MSAPKTSTFSALSFVPPRQSAGPPRFPGWQRAAGGALLLLTLAGLAVAGSRVRPFSALLPAVTWTTLTILAGTILWKRGLRPGQRPVRWMPAPVGAAACDGAPAAELAETNALLRAAVAEHEVAFRARTAELPAARREIAALRLETEALRREVHHRVKNNFQIVSSLLQLQSAFIEDPAARDGFRDSQNRIKAMAFIHELLYGPAAGGLSRLDAAAFLRRLGESLAQSVGPGGQRLALVCRATNDPTLDVDQAVPCGLILNELVARALRRGSAEDAIPGELRIELRALGDGRCALSIGAGAAGLLPEAADWRDPAALDLQLVSTLAEQLGGRLAWTREPDGGGEVRITFPQTSVPSISEQQPVA